MVKKKRFRRGDIVGVVGERGTSTIRALLPAMNAVLLETEISGFRSWNSDEVRLVKRGKSSKNGRRAVSEETREKLKAHWRKKKKG